MAKKDKNTGLLILVGLVGVGVLYALSKNENKNEADELEMPYGGTDPDTGLPRGIANKNPLNLSLSNINWQGKVPNSYNTDRGTPRLEQFNELWYGIRANLLNINSYIDKQPGMPFHQFISLWGTGKPDQYGKNQAVTNYANYVVKQMQKYGYPTMNVNNQIQPFHKYDLAGLRPSLWALFRGMAEYENGVQFAPIIAQMKADYDKAFNNISNTLLTA
jgi:hypothetical protein